MILAQVVLQTFCWQGSTGLYNGKVKKKKRRKWGITLQRKKRKKKYWFSYFSYLFHISNFKILSLTVLDGMQSVKDAHTDARRGPNQYAPSTFSKLGAKQYNFTPSKYCKNPKNIGHIKLLVMNRHDPKFSDRQVWANSADPDQTGPREAVWSGTTLFAIPSASFGRINSMIKPTC